MLNKPKLTEEELLARIRYHDAEALLFEHHGQHSFAEWSRGEVVRRWKQMPKPAPVSPVPPQTEGEE